MYPSPQGESRPHSAAVISALVVANIIWWMVMIAAIGLGAINMNNCKVEPRIPIYLIVFGAVSLLAFCVTYVRNTWDDGFACILSGLCMSFLHLFSFCWFIAGSIWVYSVYPPNYNPAEVRYCNKIAFQFAFIVTTLTWAILALMFVCGCCFIVMTCGTTVRARRLLIPTRSSFYGATSQEPSAGDV